MSIVDAFLPRTKIPRATALSCAIALAVAVALAGHGAMADATRAHLIEGNDRELEALDRASRLIVQERSAMRDLVSADDPQELARLERVFDDIQSRYGEAQARLVALFASDPRTSDDERSLLHSLQVEQAITIVPMERTVSYALKNHDAGARKLLRDQIFPHHSSMLQALAALEHVQRDQNAALESEAR